MGDEPDLEKVPPDINDFPTSVHVAFDIFNALSDSYISAGMGGIIYSGKNYGSFTTLAEMLLVDSEDRLEVFRIVSHLDARARAKALKDANKKTKK